MCVCVCVRACLCADCVVVLRGMKVKGMENRKEEGGRDRVQGRDTQRDCL